MTLTIQDLGALGELLGSAAVLVTLIYLALQTRQNGRALGAQVDSARTQNAFALNSLYFMSPELQGALAADRVNDGAVDEARRNRFWALFLGHHQWQLIHGRQGLVPTYNEVSVARAIALNFEGYRSFEEFWERQKPGLLPEFVAFVEEQRAKAA